MTSDEFKAFKRSLANPVVKYKLGKISADDLCEALYVVLGKETYDETKQLIEEAKKI